MPPTTPGGNDTDYSSTPLLMSVLLRGTFSEGATFDPAIAIAVYNRGEDGDMTLLDYAAGEFDVKLTRQDPADGEIAAFPHVFSAADRGEWLISVTRGLLRAAPHSVEVLPVDATAPVYDDEVRVVPVKVRYKAGEAIDKTTDLAVFTRDAITGDMTHLAAGGFTLAAAGMSATSLVHSANAVEVTVTVPDYPEFGSSGVARYNIWVGEAPPLGQARLEAMPLKKSYFTGQTVTASHLEVYKHRADGSAAKLGNKDFTLLLEESPFVTPGPHTVTVSDSAGEADDVSYTVWVDASSPVYSDEVRIVPVKVRYNAGDKIDKTVDLAVFTRNAVTGDMTHLAAGRFTLAAAGMSATSLVHSANAVEVTVTVADYPEFGSSGVARYNIWVGEAPPLGQARLDVMPLKKSYLTGQTVTASHLEVYKHRADGSAAKLGGSGFTLSMEESPFATSGPHTVTVSDNAGEADSVSYTVWVDASSSFTPVLLVVPLKTNYLVGESIDPENDLTVYKSQSNGQLTTLPQDRFNIDIDVSAAPFDPFSMPGQVTVTVTDIAAANPADPFVYRIHVREAQSEGSPDDETPAPPPLEIEPEEPDDPDAEIKISKVGDLKIIAEAPDGDYILEEDITITGKWTPIGGKDGFAGRLNGNGHTITFDNVEFENLPESDFSIPYNQNPKPKFYNIGFIGINRGSIHNLTVAGTISYTTKEGDDKNSIQMGAIAGSSDGGTIRNSRSFAQVTLTAAGTTKPSVKASTAQTVYVGGIVGYIRNSILTHVANHGNIWVKHNGTNDTPNRGYGVGAVGGIVGSGNGKFVIDSSYSVGVIESFYDRSHWGVASGYRLTGGIAGQIYNDTGGTPETQAIQNCFVLNTVTTGRAEGDVIEQDGYLYTGGLVGWSTSSIISPSASRNKVHYANNAALADRFTGVNRYALEGGDSANTYSNNYRVDKVYRVTNMASQAATTSAQSVDTSRGSTTAVTLNAADGPGTQDKME